jgi:hypothetical protein
MFLWKSLILLKLAFKLFQVIPLQPSAEDEFGLMMKQYPSKFSSFAHIVRVVPIQLVQVNNSPHPEYLVYPL